MNENNVNNVAVPVAPIQPTEIQPQVEQPVVQPIPASPALVATAPEPIQPTPAVPVQNSETNKPMQTIDSNEKNIDPNAVMNANINVGANAPTNIDEIQIDTVTIDASSEITAQQYVEKEKYKISGTADESELKLQSDEPKEEVLDELQIKRDLQKDSQKFKKDILFIVTFIGVIFLAIAFFPLLTKIFGIKSAG